MKGEIGKVKKLKVNVRMGRSQSFGGDNEFTLNVVDETSNLNVLEVTIDIEGFADLLTNRPAYGEGVLCVDERIGKTHENQTVLLDLANYGDMKALRKLAKKWEKENPGWKVDAYNLDTWNSHNYENKKYKVIARRWV